MVNSTEIRLEDQLSKLETADASTGFGTRGWILILIGWMCFYMSASAVNDSLNVTIPLFKSLYGWSDGSISRIATYSGWVGALLTLPAAMVMRKKGTRFVLLCSEAIMCFCVLMLGFITDVFVYALNFVMITFAGNCIGQLAFGALASHWFPRKKGSIMGWATVGCNLGSCTVVWLLAASFTLPSVHLYFVPYCLIPAAAFILTLLFIKDFPEEAGCYPDNDKQMTPEMARKIYEEGQAYVKTSPWTTKKILALRQSWCIIFGLGIFQLCTMGIVSHIVPILSSRGFTDEQALIGMTAAGIFAIPTTAGTSSEITNVAALVDTKSVRKYVVIDNKIIADKVICDTEFTRTVPPGVMAVTGLDAITHALESYVSNEATYLTKYNSLRGLQIFHENLPRVFKDGNDMEARENMMLGCIVVGFGFSNANLGLVHAIAHTLSAHFGLAHGVANACVLPYVTEFNAEKTPKEMIELAKAIDLPLTGKEEEDKYALSRELLCMVKEMGIKPLREQGREKKITEADFDIIATDALKEGPLHFNPRQDVTKEVIIDILKKAF